MAQCEFEKTNGKSCGAPALTGSRLCFFHDPAEAAKRKEAQSAGGLASSEGRSTWEWEHVEPMALDTLEDVVQLIIEQLNELRGLQPSPRKATSLFYGIGLLVKLYELLVLERRLAEMEAFLEVEVESWLWTRERLPEVVP